MFASWNITKNILIVIISSPGPWGWCLTLPLKKDIRLNNCSKHTYLKTNVKQNHQHSPTELSCTGFLWWWHHSVTEILSYITTTIPRRSWHICIKHHQTKVAQKLVGGFNPSEKIWVKIGKSSPSRGENKKYLKPPPRYSALPETNTSPLEFRWVPLTPLDLHPENGAPFFLTTKMWSSKGSIVWLQLFPVHLVGTNFEQRNLEISKSQKNYIVEPQAWKKSNLSTSIHLRNLGNLENLAMKTWLGHIQQRKRNKRNGLHTGSGNLEWNSRHPRVLFHKAQPWFAFRKIEALNHDSCPTFLKEKTCRRGSCDYI